MKSPQISKDGEVQQRLIENGFVSVDYPDVNWSTKAEYLKTILWAADLDYVRFLSAKKLNERIVSFGNGKEVRIDGELHSVPVAMAYLKWGIRFPQLRRNLLAEIAHAEEKAGH